MNKRALIHALVGEIGREIEVMKRAASAAREAATHEESRPENDKDTRGLEAAYLAGAQAERVSELERLVNLFEFLPLRTFSAQDPISASALIEVDVEGKRSRYFMAPQGGGRRVEVEGAMVHVISPVSPVGQALLGRVQGDVVEVRTEGRLREYEIIDVR